MVSAPKHRWTIKTYERRGRLRATVYHGTRALVEDVEVASAYAFVGERRLGGQVVRIDDQENSIDVTREFQ